MFPIFFVFAMTIFCAQNSFIRAESKMYYGQRIFTDARSVDMIDPAKHGFHIVLNSEFIRDYLQPVNMPVVYASAIALSKQQTQHQQASRHSSNSNKPNANSQPPQRITKILYPEKGDPDIGLLDGRAIKILGLQELAWYYVCVEFESNVNRHELATGSSCQLARTLDKFGKGANSTISEIEVQQISDKSIALEFEVEADFPMFLHIFLRRDENAVDKNVVDVPAQTFFVRRPQTLNVIFGPYLKPDTNYGKVCVLEEPLSSVASNGASFTDAYTAMGRPIRATLENCYDAELKTKKYDKDEKPHFPEPQIRKVNERALNKGCASRRSFGTFIFAMLIFVFLYAF